MQCIHVLCHKLILLFRSSICLYSCVLCRKHLERVLSTNRNYIWQSHAWLEANGLTSILCFVILYFFLLQYTFQDASSHVTQTCESLCTICALLDISVFCITGIRSSRGRLLWWRHCNVKVWTWLHMSGGKRHKTVRGGNARSARKSRLLRETETICN